MASDDSYKIHRNADLRVDHGYLSCCCAPFLFRCNGFYAAPCCAAVHRRCRAASRGDLGWTWHKHGLPRCACNDEEVSYAFGETRWVLHPSKTAMRHVNRRTLSPANKTKPTANHGSFSKRATPAVAQPNARLANRLLIGSGSVPESPFPDSTARPCR